MQITLPAEGKTCTYHCNFLHVFSDAGEVLEEFELEFDVQLEVVSAYHAGPFVLSVAIGEYNLISNIKYPGFISFLNRLRPLTDPLFLKVNEFGDVESLAREYKLIHKIESLARAQTPLAEDADADKAIYHKLVNEFPSDALIRSFNKSLLFTALFAPLGFDKIRPGNQGNPLPPRRKHFDSVLFEGIELECVWEAKPIEHDPKHQGRMFVFSANLASPEIYERIKPLSEKQFANLEPSFENYLFDVDVDLIIGKFDNNPFQISVGLYEAINQVLEANQTLTLWRR